MNWLDWIYDIHKWKHGSALFRTCFWSSLLLTIELIAVASSADPTLLRLNSSNEVAHLLVAAAEIILLIGAALLWVGMLTYCMSFARSAWAKVLWGIFFFAGIFWAADLYYLAVYLWRPRVVSIAQKSL